MLVCGSKQLDLSRPVVMGVLNVTPDSFSDGGRYLAPASAVARGLEMVEQGAAIIDVGGESTRPGAAAVSVQQELDRVVPVIEALVTVPAIISVDTSKPEVMQAAVAAGAGLINDVRALTLPSALDFARQSAAAVCLMHMRGEPGSMQDNPTYGDVVTEVKAFLADRAQACRQAGIPDNRLLVDPGFGFGKTLQHNLALLRGLREFLTLGLPVLVGLSRKSMIAALTGRGVTQRDAGSAALAMLAVQRGASIVRAHDVAGTVDALRILAAVANGD